MIPLLPLETLPGWPEAPEWSVTHLLWLTVLGPVTVAVVVALLAFTPTLARRFRGEPEPSTEVAVRPRHSAPESNA